MSLPLWSARQKLLGIFVWPGGYAGATLAVPFLALAATSSWRYVAIAFLLRPAGRGRLPVPRGWEAGRRRLSPSSLYGNSAYTRGMASDTSSANEMNGVASTLRFAPRPTRFHVPTT